MWVAMGDQREPMVDRSHNERPQRGRITRDRMPLLFNRVAVMADASSCAAIIDK